MKEINKLKKLISSGDLTPNELEYTKQLLQWLLDWIAKGHPKPGEPIPEDDGGSTPPAAAAAQIMIIKLTILFYTFLHGFFTVCDHCMADSHYWTPYYIIDGLVGGGVILWYVAYLYCKVTHSKYRVAAFMTMLYSAYMLLWNIVIPALGYNRSDTTWSFLLTLALIGVIYFTIFVPKGRLTTFLDEHLKRIGA